MNHLLRILLAASLSLVLGACSLIDHRSVTHDDDDLELPETPDQDVETADDITDSEIEIVIEVIEPEPEPGLQDEVLLFGHNWLGLSEEAQRQELAQAELAWSNTRTDLALVRYALLTALSRPVQPGASDRVRNELRNWLAQQKTMIGQDELAPLAGMLLYLLDDREQLISEMMMQIDEVQRKLDELRAIEQQMRERESTEIIRTLP